LHILIDAISDNAHVRGPDRYLLELLGGLARLNGGHRYTLCFAPWQSAFADVELPASFTRVCLRAPRSRTLRVLWHAAWFPRLAARMQADLVFLPNLIFAPFLGCPSVMTVHDLAHFRFPEKFGRVRGALLRALLRADFRAADRVISVSQFTTDDVERFIGYPRSRIHQIPEGGPEPRPPAPVAQDPPYLLYVGQLERSKNVEGLVAAFCRSRALEEAGVELRIAGHPGNAADDIRRVVEECGPERVRLLGYVDEERLAELYGRCLAFVFPSLVEGFGLVLLEAMAHGAPVVAMGTSAIPEVVGDAGLIVDPADADGLRRAMEEIAANGELRGSLRKRGYERLKSFSWTEAARQSLAVFEQAAAETRAS
jgi:glycosyltransferase involved in cell wall biosynthesis